MLKDNKPVYNACAGLCLVGCERWIGELRICARFSSYMPMPRPKLEHSVNFMDTVSESCLRGAHTLPPHLLFGSRDCSSYLDKGLDLYCLESKPTSS